MANPLPIAVFKIASVSEARPDQSFSYSIGVVRDHYVTPHPVG